MRKKIELILTIILTVVLFIFVPWLVGAGPTVLGESFVAHWLSGLVAIIVILIGYFTALGLWKGISTLWNKVWNRIEGKK